MTVQNTVHVPWINLCNLSKSQSSFWNTMYRGLLLGIMTAACFHTVDRVWEAEISSPAFRNVREEEGNRNTGWSTVYGNKWLWGHHWNDCFRVLLSSTHFVDAEWGLQLRPRNACFSNSNSESQVLTSVVSDSSVLWDMTPCCLCWLCLLPASC
jgi:hypothetical protein